MSFRLNNSRTTQTSLIFELVHSHCYYHYQFYFVVSINENIIVIIHLVYP